MSSLVENDLNPSNWTLFRQCFPVSLPLQRRPKPCLLGRQAHLFERLQGPRRTAGGSHCGSGEGPGNLDPLTEPPKRKQIGELCWCRIAPENRLHLKQMGSTVAPFLEFIGFTIRLASLSN
jgi:hypothetical protein